MSRFRAVDELRADYPVKRLCRLLKVSTSGFYAWKRRPPSARAVVDAELVGAHGRKQRKRRTVEVAPAPDLLQRDFTAERPNQRWVADISEFKTGEGKLYVAAIRDLCHRGIVGWSMADHHRAELVVDALTMALGRTTIDTYGLIHHSDKGGEYLSDDFAVASDVPNLRLSFGRTGDAYDNAAMETVWATIKREIVHIRGSLTFDTRSEAQSFLFDYIEIFYNRQRHQARLNHHTPVEYAANFAA